jgi:hypothetical protein
MLLTQGRAASTLWLGNDAKIPTNCDVWMCADWPVLHEGDGGREVHALQVALERAGFYPSGVCLF